MLGEAVMVRNGKCFIYYIEATGSSYGLLWEVACIEKLTHYRLASYWKEHWYGPRIRALYEQCPPHYFH